MSILDQARLRPHRLEFPPLADAAKYRPFTESVLAWAGVSADASSFERASALIAWVAGHCLHPGSELHPNGHTAGVAVLPPGETWTTFNAEYDKSASFSRDNAFWYGLYPDGCAMLEALIGAVDSQGTVSDDGMLTEYASDLWRIRDFASFRAPQCTLQAKIAQVLLAAQGIYCVDLTINSHDPMIFHENETGRWLWVDNTYGTFHQLTGTTAALTAVETLALSLAGRSDEIEGVPAVAAMDWIVGSYFDPGLANGVEWVAVHTRPQWSGGIKNRSAWRFDAVHSSYPSNIAAMPVDGAEGLVPELGCGIAGYRELGEAIEIRLRSNWPGHVAFERSDDAGVTWAACPANNYVASATGEVRFRSIDALGFSGKPAIIDC